MFDKLLVRISIIVRLTNYNNVEYEIVELDLKSQRLIILSMFLRFTRLPRR